MNIVLVEQNFLPKTCLLAMLMRSKDLTLYLTRFPLTKIYIPLIYNEKIPEKHLWRSLVFSEVSSQRPLNSLIMTLHRCIPGFFYGKSVRWNVYVGNIGKQMVNRTFSNVKRFSRIFRGIR